MLEPFGLTGRRAEWIALASLHGGVFSRSQLSDWFGMDRFKTLRFVQFLTPRRLAARCRSMSVRVTSGSLCTKTALGCDTHTMPQVAGVVAFVPQSPGRPMAVGRVRPLTGATHVFGMPHTARARLGCARPSHPPVGSLPVQQSHAGRPKGESERARAERLFDHSRPPDGQPVGERVIHRLDAALTVPSRRDDSRGAIPEGGGDERVTTRTAPRRTGHLCPWGRSQPHPRSVDRHRRSAGRGATASAPATCTTGPCPVERRFRVRRPPK